MIYWIPTNQGDVDPEIDVMAHLKRGGVRWKDHSQNHLPIFTFSSFLHVKSKTPLE